MGIPGLLSVFEDKKADRHETLSKLPAVIDGPAWAYYLLRKCRSLGEGDPSYHLLVESAVKWLRLMESQGVEIQAVYFDQHLPQEKLPIRMQRVVNATQETRRCNSSLASGVPLSYAQHPPNSPQNIRHIFNAAGQPPTRLPNPPFLVPALMEGLRAHKKYTKLLVGVPGEADAFCAQHVKELDEPSYIFTSDSDLLVHDIGKADVVMFKDLDQRHRGNEFTAFAHNQAALASCLELNSVNDLRAFAYLKNLDPYQADRALATAVEKREFSEEGFAEFIASFDQAVTQSPKEPTMWDGQVIQRHSMDPRVSEVVLQYQDLTVEPRIMRLFLPPLLEDGDRTSPWDGSLFVRQLAFSIPLQFLLSPAQQLQEYKKVQSAGQKGRDVKITADLGKVLGLSNQILGPIKRCQEAAGHSSRDIFWIALCFCLNIETGQVDRDFEDMFICKTLRKYIRQDISGAQDMPWDAVHLLAHVQATLYSLRIFKQIADGIGSVSLNRANATLETLRLSLESLPPIAEWPDVASLPALLSAGSLSRTIDLVIATSSQGSTRLSDVLLGTGTARPPGHGLRKKQKKKRKEAAKSKPRGDPNNRFGALEM